MDEQISQAEASYQAQLGVLANSYIYAPVDGTITTIKKKVGETAVTGETVIQIADLDNYIFEISIDQEDYGYIKTGQPVRIELDSYASYNFNTILTEMPFIATPTTGVFDIKIPVKGDDQHKLAIGMLGDAYIDVLTTESEVKVLTIDEIFYDNSDNPYVWVVDNGKLKKLPIELGAEGDIYTEIKTEVQEVVVPAEENQKMVEGYFAKIIN
jgi:multidrug efflux pump subunit AcrA (membrane-fusion protein)